MVCTGSVNIEPGAECAWEAWCRAAEGLLSAYKAGGPCPHGDQPVLGGGAAVFRTMLVGGRAADRLHRSARADEIDTDKYHAFINSPLALVILFRWVHSVGAVLKCIWNSGFSSARWQALMLWWAAVCGQSPTCLIKAFDPGRDWLLPNLHGFYKCFF